MNDFLSVLQISWAVSAGFAINLFLGSQTRARSDIDIFVFLKPIKIRVCVYMLYNKCNVYEFRGQEKLRSLNSKLSSKISQNLMCVKNDCDFVKFFHVKILIFE